MSSMIPQEYYESEVNHGSYVYITLEELVTNFVANYTGDGKILGKSKRSQIIYQFKQGIKKFSINALREVKAVELELGDTLDITLPPDYVNYVRISYVNPDTGELMVLSVNDDMPLATAYLQDHDAAILFDDNGFILEGTTYFTSINDNVTQRNIIGTANLCEIENPYTFDPARNANGTFHIDTRQGRIHFSSDNASRVLLLEYISDGLEYSNESDIKVTKLAEEALYHYVNYYLMFTLSGVPLYEKNEAKKAWESSYKNAKIALMNIKIPDLMLALNARRKLLK